jgi:hypothetical protein
MPVSRRSLLTLPFVLAAVVLALAAVGLRPGIAALTTHFSKASIDLRRELSTLDVGGMPSFRPAATEHEWSIVSDDVGTTDVFEGVLELKSDVPDEDLAAADRMYVVFFITYYSDPREQVPHTAEICYREGGATISRVSTIRIETPGLGPDNPSVHARLVDLIKEGRRRVVLYAFSCNGDYYDDRESVRFRIGWPGDKHVYFCKVEAAAECATDADYEKAVAACSAAIAESLPLLERDHLPTRAQLR